jgi:mannose-1-phosphate guanylyltransferase
MRDRIRTAMILAAGKGTRLRPLTNYLAKPLIPIGRTTLLERTMGLLAAIGIKRIVINLHHLAEQVEGYAREVAPPGVELCFSREEDILGSGGGIGKASDHFAGGSVLVVNGDLLFDLELEKLIQSHQGSDALATCLTVPADRDPALATVTLDTKDKILEITREGAPQTHPGRRGIFSGIYILEPEAWARLPKEQFCSIVTEVYRPLMARNLARGWMAKGPWYDLGTPERYEAALFWCLTPPTNASQE